MKQLCLAIVLFACSVTLFASTAPDERDQILSLARETISEARYAALVTVDEDGQPRARTVDAFPPDDAFVVRVATRPVTRKVEQIRNHDQVTLYYFDAVNRNYVTIMGRATLVTDVARLTELRREADSDRLYPDFPDDYLIIEITPLWLEGILPGYRGDRETWRPVGVRFPAE